MGGARVDDARPPLLVAQDEHGQSKPPRGLPPDLGVGVMVRDVLEAEHDAQCERERVTLGRRRRCGTRAAHDRRARRDVDAGPVAQKRPSTEYGVGGANRLEKVSRREAADVENRRVLLGSPDE